MDPEQVKTLHFLPDSIPGDDDQCVDVYGSATTEEHRPSLRSTRKSALQSLGFTPSQQHAKNVGVLLQCDECDKWQKLNSLELESIIDDISYTCGFSLSEVSLSWKLKGVCVKNHLCSDPIEKLYYSCGLELICYWCASLDVTEDSEHFPTCGDCKGKVKVNQPKRKQYM